MAKMYDTMGDMLSQFLDDGILPPPTNTAQEDSSPENKPARKKIIFEYLPTSTQKAFKLLRCNPDMNFEDVKKSYHALLKKNHPDTKAYNQDDIHIQDIKSAYEELEKFYS